MLRTLPSEPAACEAAAVAPFAAELEAAGASEELPHAAIGITIAATATLLMNLEMFLFIVLPPIRFYAVCNISLQFRPH